MKYVIAKVMDGHWFYYVCRNCWTDNVYDAELLRSESEAQTHIEIMPDGDEVGALILPVTLTVKH